MANEPERPIEKLLRAAAKKRRDDAGAPFELHPADRRLLQGEVARRFAQPQPEGRSFLRGVARLWPRFAWGLPVLAVLGLVVWLLLPAPGGNPPVALVAKNEPASAPMPVQKALPSAPETPPVTLPPEPAAAAAPMATPVSAIAASQPGVPPPLVAADRSTVNSPAKVEGELLLAAGRPTADKQEQAPGQLAFAHSADTPASAATLNRAYGARYGLAARPTTPAGSPPTLSAPSATAMTPPAPSVIAADDSAKLTGDRSDTAATQYRAVVAAAPVNQLSPSSVATDALSKELPKLPAESKASTITQRFMQGTSQAKAKSTWGGRAAAAFPVLASFRLEQAGPELRIVDADGSVYTGYAQMADNARRPSPAKTDATQAAPALRAPEGTLAKKAAFDLDAGDLGTRAGSFRVVGTNRTLGKRIVFTGTLLAVTNSTVSLPLATNSTFLGGLGGSPSASARQPPGPLLNSRISGQLMIGSGKPVEINAVPTGP